MGLGLAPGASAVVRAGRARGVRSWGVCGRLLVVLWVHLDNARFAGCTHGAGRVVERRRVPKCEEVLRRLTQYISSLCMSAMCVYGVCVCLFMCSNVCVVVCV